MGNLCGAGKEEKNDVSNKSVEKKQDWVRPDETDAVLLKLKINRDKLSARVKTLEKEEQKFEQKIMDFMRAGINF